MKKSIAEVPKRPGVYIFKGPKGQTLYVGKAKSLRGRLLSYFGSGADARRAAMMKAVKDFSYIVTDNELEALALEASLIKRLKPKFNVVLRDDKSYPYLKFTVKDEWPAIEVVRRIKKDGSLYFGPYVPASSMWESLAFVRRHFGIRPCRLRLEKPMRPCIQYEMGKCPAPCAGLVSKEDYAKAVNDAILFLKGKKRLLLDELEGRMRRLSGEMRFEEAAVIRDRISSLRKAWETQKVISPGLGDIDVVGLYGEGEGVSFQVFFIRGGVMIGAQDFYLKDVRGIPPRELIGDFLEVFYSKEIIPPEEIVAALKPRGLRQILGWLEEKRGAKVKMTAPLRGKKLQLLRMAEENARLLFQRKRDRGDEDMLEELKELLSLPFAPRSIGAFDVSTTGGSEPVGAFVYWAGGEFKKDLYRRLKIKTVSGMDDYAMMAEIVKRVMDDMTDNPPDLLIIDGGRAHLEAARRALEEIGLEGGVGLVAVAKKPDRVITDGLERNIDDRRSSSLLLRRVRDEAHRFAISFHKRLRGKGLLKSRLEDVPGIGKKRRLALLRRFGSLDAVRQAGVDELASVPGMNRRAAEALKGFFASGGTPAPD